MDREKEYIEEPEAEQVAEEQSEQEKSDDINQLDVKLHEDKYEIVTRVAFLCGVSEQVFTADNNYFLTEVIDQLGKEPKSVYNTLQRVRKKLKKLLCT